MDLINREKLKSTIRAMVEIPNEVRVKVLGAISREKAVDAVPAVRCKDCKYQIKEWHPDNRMISKGYYTYGCDRNFHRYSSNAVNGRDNEFCSHGERRNDG